MFVSSARYPQNRLSV